MIDLPDLTPEQIQARVLHRDGLMLVIDKPAGLPVHRGPKGGPNLEASFDALRFGLPRPPVLAHRLDRETSGCLLLGRHRKATASLGLLFKHGRISKTYWAVVEGGPAEAEGVIDLPLGRLNAERGWWQKVDPDGQPSVTRWTVMGRSFLPAAPNSDDVPVTSPLVAEVDRAAIARGVSSGATASGYPARQPSPTRAEGAGSARFTWLALEPVTGRTHQLRVHCAAMGWPIVGDNIYGHAATERRAQNLPFVPEAGAARLHLHAREIVIPLSRNKPPVQVTAPVPEHLHERLRACGWDGI